MATAYCSRDKGFKQEDGTKNEDIVDFLNYTYFKSSVPLDLYNASYKKSLLNLTQKVMTDELTDKQRQAVILVKARGLKQKQAALRMGITASTISRHLKAAQKKFDYALKFFELNKTQLYE